MRVQMLGQDNFDPRLADNPYYMLGREGQAQRTPWWQSIIEKGIDTAGDVIVGINQQEDLTDPTNSTAANRRAGQPVQPVYQAAMVSPWVIGLGAAGIGLYLLSRNRRRR